MEVVPQVAPELLAAAGRGDDAAFRALVQRFIEAMERRDRAIVGPLTDDARFAMPPYVTWYRGRDRVAESWLMPGERPGRLPPPMSSGGGDG